MISVLAELNGNGHNIIQDEEREQAFEQQWPESEHLNSNDHKIEREPGSNTQSIDKIPSN